MLAACELARDLAEMGPAGDRTLVGEQVRRTNPSIFIPWVRIAKQVNSRTHAPHRSLPA